jgi:hypothetical protein
MIDAALDYLLEHSDDILTVLRLAANAYLVAIVIWYVGQIKITRREP